MKAWRYLIGACALAAAAPGSASIVLWQLSGSIVSGGGNIFTGVQAGDAITLRLQFDTELPGSVLTTTTFSQLDDGLVSAAVVLDDFSYDLGAIRTGNFFRKVPDAKVIGTSDMDPIFQPGPDGEIVAFRAIIGFEVNFPGLFSTPLFDGESVSAVGTGNTNPGNTFINLVAPAPYNNGSVSIDYTDIHVVVCDTGSRCTFPPLPVPPPTGVVPEPASWALMISGFALAGAAMRRRTKLTVTAAT